MIARVGALFIDIDALSFSHKFLQLYARLITTEEYLESHLPAAQLIA